MSNENKSIHEFDINLICEYFSNINRQGPGSRDTTLKALSFIDKLADNSQIADIGCGTGAPTMDLAQNIEGKITGIDLFPDFIEIFNKNATKLNLENRVEGKVASMENLPFSAESLDLIWSEGSIYNIGFERGINEWRKFLKTGAFLALTEVSWLTEKRPAEIHDFWMDAYPEIDTIATKVEQLQKAGYIVRATFVLPENCWTENFYIPQINAQKEFLRKHQANKFAIELVENQRQESELYFKYKQFYGYVFYIAKKLQNF
jgi:ubiquinone/menaquinone biosynthesis C-methylase UbiE